MTDDDPLCGTVIAGRFLVLGVIGRGGMGRVFRAWQLSTRRMVALKLLLRSDSLDMAAAARFLREARTTAGLTCPHTVTVLDADTLPDGGLYLAMELLGGRPLDRVIREDGALSPRRACALMTQICLSLTEAHQRGLIHRDLKPANVMVLELAAGTEFAKVLDFGIVKVLDESATQMTADGSMHGTPAYMSPEQINGKRISAATDVYAAGVTLFQMLTGELPFRAESTMGVIMRHLTDSPPRLREVGPHLPESLERILDRCLQKSPEARFPDMAALRYALEAAELPWAARPPSIETGGNTDPVPVEEPWPASADLSGAETVEGARPAMAPPAPVLSAAPVAVPAEGDPSATPRSLRPSGSRAWRTPFLAVLGGGSAIALSVGLLRGGDAPQPSPLDGGGTVSAAPPESGPPAMWAAVVATPPRSPASQVATPVAVSARPAPAPGSRGGTAAARAGTTAARADPPRDRRSVRLLAVHGAISQAEGLHAAERLAKGLARCRCDMDITMRLFAAAGGEVTRAQMQPEDPTFMRCAQPAVHALRFAPLQGGSFGTVEVRIEP